MAKWGYLARAYAIDDYAYLRATEAENSDEANGRTSAEADRIEDVIEDIKIVLEMAEDNFITGVSTRGAIALYKASQVTAAFAGRDYVIPEDVKLVAPHVLAHRISKDSGKTAAAIKFLAKIIENVPVPLETLS